MRNAKLLEYGYFAATALLFLGVTAARDAYAQSYTRLYSFQCQPDGNYPISGVAEDAAGNLYGTTDTGGTYNAGAVFKLVVGGEESILHSFAGAPNDGTDPVGTPVLDARGDLYGTTSAGGKYDVGIIYRLNSNGTETIIHNFLRSGDGEFPDAGLIRDGAGDLYGTTSEGGGYHGGGTVFKISPTRQETILHSFGASGDGSFPRASVVRDQAGNLYGTTESGGVHGAGTVFKLSSIGKETLLYSFSGGQEGSSPYGGVALSPTGNLFGTTALGGSDGYGTVFEVSPTGKHEILHSFAGSPDGANPLGSGVVRDSAGDLYGTTTYGGAGSCNDGFGDLGCGAVFEVTSAGLESVVYSFGGGPADGEYPLAGLTIDSSGNLYGTTSGGGTHGCGTVFKYTP